MHVSKVVRQSFLTLFTVLYATAALAQTPAPAKPDAQFEPRVGQPGKDVVWVPTPQALVEKMLDIAKLTPKDFLMDLGSGDGRTVITAAKRGATAMGVEYNPDMVTLSKAAAQKAGVSRQSDLRAGRPVQDGPEQSHRHHHVPAAEHQHAAAAEHPEPEARHAHRREHLHDGRLGSRSDRVGHRQLLELVHGAPVDRPGQGAGHVENRAGHR